MENLPRILLVDDEHSLVKLVTKRLEAEGFAVSVAMDGESALQKAQAELPDLIILDVMLPKLNGYQVCQKLKNDSRYRHIPIVLFTALAQEKDEKIGFECEADAYVRKPFRAQELLEKIRSLIKPKVV